MNFYRHTQKYKINFLIFVLCLIIIFFIFLIKGLNRFSFDYKKSLEYLKILDLNNIAKNIDFKSESIEKVDTEDLKSIKAKSYLIYDLNKSKVLLGSNENIKMPLASVSKVMTAYVAEKNCKDSLRSELDEVLIASNNEAAESIASSCPNYTDFINMMNGEVKKYNLNMSFVNPSGLDINGETEASNFGDAISVARLINMLYEENEERLSHTTKDIYNNIKNTNEYASYLPFLIGSKTGFTDVAGGNLATIYEILPHKRIAIVVLGSTKEDRFRDTLILLKIYLKNLF